MQNLLTVKNELSLDMPFIQWMKPNAMIIATKTSTLLIVLCAPNTGVDSIYKSLSCFLSFIESSIKNIN